MLSRQLPFISVGGKNMNSYQEILNDIDSVRIIDVHEHLINDKLRMQRYKDYISLVFSNYTYINAVSAGTTEDDIKLLQGDLPVSQKYEVYSRACQNIKNTTSFRCLDYAFRELYGMSALDQDYEELNRRFCSENKPGFTSRVLKEMKVECAVNDVFDKSMQNTDYDMDPHIFRSAVRCDKYIMINEYLSDIEDEFHVNITSLEELCEVLKNFIKMQKETYHAVSLKIATAYYRSLYFENVDRQTAEAAFEKLLLSRNNGRTVAFQDVKPLSDYITHCIIREAKRHSLPVQIHTGVQDRNVNFLGHADPLKLNNLFALYPDVRFNIFHTGYPFGREAGVLAKMFSNVFVDFSWVHILSSKYAVDLLQEYFELLPANKFCGFGGDFCNIEGAFGHLQFAKNNIASAISGMVDKGMYSLKYGKQLARQILYDNPKAIYHI